jgi:hypothetical protein
LTDKCYSKTRIDREKNCLYENENVRKSELTREKQRLIREESYGT